MNLNIRRFHHLVPEEVNTFIIYCVETAEAMLVDAGGFDNRVIEYIANRNLNPTQIFITHGHYDHIGALKSVVDKYPDICILSGAPLQEGNVSIAEEGQSIKIGRHQGTVHLIPGHTDDGSVIAIDGHIFTGDTLFAGSVGGTSSDENYILQLSTIREMICKYPVNTIIHPGHGPDSTLELELLFNPFLRMT